jgi:cytidine deaminase
VSDLSDDDRKIVVLARGARGRVGAPEGSAVRDETGRTYSAATVGLPSLALSAVQLAVATAVAAGAKGLEAVAVCTDDEASPSPDDLAVVRDLAGVDIPVIVCDASGSVVRTALT